jgi:serine/threonine protein kinase
MDVDDYLCLWEERRESGRPAAPSDLCPDRPELLAELIRRVELLQACDKLLGLDESGNGGADGGSPAVIAGYELQDELGHGGAGVVYRVWDPSLRREAALKMLHPVGFVAFPADAERLLARFRREAQVLAQLKHEHIVPVFEARADGGRPFFVMEYVRGGSLARRLPEVVAAGPKSVVRLLERVARAVHHAHSQGILHRDLKPANILLDWQPGSGGEPLPRVSDFGLAKLLDDRVESAADTEADEVVEPETQLCPEPSRLTATGFQPGTPAYMAPEQFDPSLGAIGPATDVWALGVVLYELLTGNRPFVGRTRGELRERVLHERPARPRSPRGAVDRRLESIVFRCLEKQSSRRFASAGELADRLAGYLRFTRRRRLGAVVFTGLAVAIAGAWWVAREGTPDRRFQRSEASLAARLQRGEAIDLIEPGGKVPSYLPRGTEAPPKVRMTEEGLVVTTPMLTIVEFLDDIPALRYRIHAELRQDPTQFPPGNSSAVGITFTGRHVESPSGIHHVFGAATVTDWPDDTSPPRCRGRLQAFWYLETSVDGKWAFKREILYPPRNIAYLPRPAEKRGDWHTIDVEVAPGEWRAVLDDAQDRMMGPIREQDYLWFSGQLLKKQAAVRGVDFGPLARPAVGVLVLSGQCVIRSLRIEPLPDGGR